jgi:hypothetical protein
MNNNKLAFLLLSSMSSLLLANDQESNRRRPQMMGFHNHFDQMFQEMEQSMHQMREAFAHGMNNGQMNEGTSLNLEETEKSLLITLNGIDTDSVDATVSDDGTNLLLKTARGTLNLNTEESFVSITFAHKNEREEKNKDGKMEKVASSYSQQSYSMNLMHPLDLATEQLKIDYDAENKSLSVEIPYVSVPDKGRKAVPVNIKKAKAQEKE